MLQTLLFVILSLSNSAFAQPGGYYDQFLFKVDGDCKKIETVWFHSAYSWEDIRPGNDAQGRPVVVKLHIQLFADGTYWSEYEEDAITKVLESGGYLMETLYKGTPEGRWTVNGSQLLLENFGVGSPSQIADADGKMVPGFAFKLGASVHDDRVLNSVFNMGRSSGNSGPRGVSINQYCGVK